MKKVLMTLILALIMVAPVHVLAETLGEGGGIPIAESTSPIYITAPVIDDDGLTDDFTYIFPTGETNVKPGQTLLMVNGEFIPHLVEIRGDRSLIPLRFVTQAFGASVEWDAENGAVTMRIGDTSAIVIIGEQFAQVSKGGEIKKQDLYTAAIIINDRTYVPVRALAEIFDMAVGYEPCGITYNPVVWIDKKTPEWQPDIKALQADSMQALELLKKNINTLLDGHFADWGETNGKYFAEIEEKINDMKLIGFIGRYAIVEGPYTMLVEQNGTVYFHRPAYLMYNIHKANFDDPETFLGGYFVD